MTSVWISVLCSAVLMSHGYAQFSFGTIYDFDLSTDVTFPTSGDDVTLSCRRTDRYKRKVSQNFLDQGDQIAWEMNDRALLVTEVDLQGNCMVSEDSSFLGRPSFGQSRTVRYTNVSCKDDGTTVKLTLHEWIPGQLLGDTWRCVQFPFAESAKLNIQSFVPLRNVAIKEVVDKGNRNNPSRGTIVTCRTSPCRPYASIDWFLKDGDNDVMIASQMELQEQVDTGRNGLLVTTGAVLFTSDADHGKEVYCKSSNSRDQNPVYSQNISLTVIYPPSLTVRVVPQSSVVEGSDVTLHCSVYGRPTPEVKWTRKAQKTGEEDVLVSLSSTVTFTSVSMADKGEYVCTASNGLEPDASAAVVLFVRENISAHEAHIITNTNSLSNTDMEDTTDVGAVAGGIIAAFIIVILVAVIVYLVLRHRRSKQERIGNSSGLQVFDNGDGQGIYATCSTLPRTSQPPPYLDILPPVTPDQKLSKLSNPGYGMDDMIIAGRNSSRRANANRPLPSTPLDCDSGYEEIVDYTVSGVPQNEAPSIPNETVGRGHNEAPRHNDVTFYLVNDGYEIPVNPRNTSQADLPSSSGTRRYSEIFTGPRPSYKSASQHGVSHNKKRKSVYTNECNFDTSF